MGILKRKPDVQPEVSKPEAVLSAAVPESPTCKAPVDGKPCGNALAVGQSEVCPLHVRAG